MMFLIKCGCGCHFTILKRSENVRSIRCQSCGKGISVDVDSDFLTVEAALAEKGLTIHLLPGNATFEVKFPV